MSIAFYAQLTVRRRRQRSGRLYLIEGAADEARIAPIIDAALGIEDHSVRELISLAGAISLPKRALAAA